MPLLVLRVGAWRSGSEGEEGLIWHAVGEPKAPRDGPALCGVQPVRSWSGQMGATVPAYVPSADQGSHGGKGLKG